MSTFPVCCRNLSQDQKTCKLTLKRRNLILLFSTISCRPNYRAYSCHRVSSILARTTDLNYCYLGNNSSFEGLISSIQQVAEDISEPGSQKAALLFLTRCVAAYGQLATGGSAQNIGTQQPSAGLPGFERIIYEQLVPTVFRVPASPDINLKDGQVTVVRAFLVVHFLPYTLTSRSCTK